MAHGLLSYRSCQTTGGCPRCCGTLINHDDGSSCINCGYHDWARAFQAAGECRAGPAPLRFLYAGDFPQMHGRVVYAVPDASIDYTATNGNPAAGCVVGCPFDDKPMAGRNNGGFMFTCPEGHIIHLGIADGIGALVWT